jgi:hypothetical protein
MVANINVDGLAFLEDFGDVVGIGAEYSDLGERLEKVAEGLGLEVSRPNDVRWGHDAYLRSDQAVFAEAGVPALLVNEGFTWEGVSRQEARERALKWLATVYHTPADDLTQPLDFEASRKHAELLLALTIAVADAPSPPRWRSGSPYAYRRLLRLADER